MRRVRINPTPIFVTALCACLGLVAAGAITARVHTVAASSVLSEISAATTANLSYSHSSNQALGIEAGFVPRPLALASPGESEPHRFLYRSANPSTASRSILIVTCMPRASLESTPA